MKEKYMRYGAAINLNGLYSAKPVGLIFNPDLEDWYDETGDFSIPRIGMTENEGLITFSSVRKADVQRWIDGAKSALSLLNSWSTVAKK